MRYTCGHDGRTIWCLECCPQGPAKSDLGNFGEEVSTGVRVVSQPKYQITCKYCGCVLEYTNKDIRSFVDPDMSFLYIICHKKNGGCGGQVHVKRGGT